MKRRIMLVAAVVIAFSNSSGQSKPGFFSPSSHAAPNLVLLCLAAHPDDEDDATLAYYSALPGMKAYSLFFTRGEGGQNEIGSELYGDLGTLRTRETCEAAAIVGSEPHFLGFADFGYSKTAKETFAKWGGKESALSRLVYYIRLLQPDVIVTNHDTVTTKPGRQHGNHQAVGISVYEAFAKAADPAFHPEQLRGGISPWQVRKLFSRFVGQDSMAHPDSLVTVNTARQVRNDSTVDDIAIAAMRRHRSQGLEHITLASMSPQFRAHRYCLVREDHAYPFDKSDLFSGLRPISRTLHRIDIEPPPHVPVEHPPDPAKIAARHAANIFVGLIKTYDDTIEQLLGPFRIPFQLLDSTAVARADLSKFTVIILDLRAYQYRPDIATGNQRLLEYVRLGGNIVCFYHKQGDWNQKQPAPYPITITGERVTEEDTAVDVLAHDHPFFNEPNPIRSSDWKGWIQERSIYLPSEDTTKTSARYQRLLAMSDEGEHQPSTSLLWARYGQGTYAYCALALYRQLRNLDEGAVKLFFNIISQARQ